jgi:1,4-alpha-glucan branching enzyme
MDGQAPAWRLSPSDARALVEARHGDPFAVLGAHVRSEGVVIRAFVPHAETLEARTPDGRRLAVLDRLDPAGLFEGLIEGRGTAPEYRLHAANGGGAWSLDDPYRFPPVLGALDDHLLVEGSHRRLWERLGAHLMEHQGVAGVHFAVWAPHARRVSVVGDFNGWDGRRGLMRKRVDSGIWELFLPDAGEGTRYKFEIAGPDGQLQPLKADPFGFAAQLRPQTASVVADISGFAWSDEAWMARRAQAAAHREPVSTYEVHLGSWRRGPEGRFLTYDELADSLLPYAAEMGFTHLELMPVSEHPLDDSWGYQPIGLFAPTSRFGDPSGFARFVDRAHAAGLGVILDWPAAHFPVDAHGLYRFDGTALYEHADPRKGFHPDWNTAIFDFGRREVANVLLANALFWLEVFHVDGLRVDAVASMLYLDYSRKAGEWLPNVRGGRENLEAETFLKSVNVLTHEHAPGVQMIAEESTTWPGVSRPVHQGGLGFGFKWNMGWMNDTLEYVSRDPVHRRHHHHDLTFGLVYAFSENFVLPISHDEVVHGKGSLLGRMPGDDWGKFAGARGYLGFMWGYPGKKLLFMGQEFGQRDEWNFRQSLDWHLLDHAPHEGLRRTVADLNRIYRQHPALHRKDGEADGFRWLVADDAANSVIAWLRLGEAGDAPVAVACNFTPVPRVSYRIGLPHAGVWREVFNSDADVYGGSGMGNLGQVVAHETSWGGQPASAEIVLPPMATVYFQHAPQERPARGDGAK